MRASHSFNCKTANARPGAIGIDLLLAIFAIACFLTAAIFFSGSSGKSFSIAFQPQASINSPWSGAKTFSVPNDKQVYRVRFAMSPSNLPWNSGWSNATISVLDDSGKQLFGFGGDVWRASGRDEDGPWRETKSQNEMKVTFEKAGTYTLEAEVSTTAKRFNQKLTVIFEPRRGSSLPFTIVGVLALIAAVAFHMFTKPGSFQSLGDSFSNFDAD